MKCSWMCLFVVIPISKLLHTLLFLCMELGNMPQVLLPTTFFCCHLGVYLLSLVKNFVIWLCLQLWSNLLKKQTNKQKSLDDECARFSSQNAQIVFFFLMWMAKVWFWLWCNNGNFCNWISIKKEKVCGSWWSFFSNLIDLHRLMFLLILKLCRS